MLLRLLSSVLLVSIGVAQSPQNLSITSAASFQKGLPAKGSIGAIFCTGLQVDGVVQAQGTPLPLVLAAVSVTVGGAAAPLLAVANLGGYQQINFEVPQQAVSNEDTTVTIVVSQSGGQSSVRVPVSTSPGEFFRIGGGAGAFQHGSDFSIVTGENPARPGEVLIGYMTGLPGSEPVVRTGEAAPFSPLAVVPQPNIPGLVDQYALLVNGTVVANEGPTIHVPCRSSSILFLGLSPGSVGVYQINFVVPASAPAGNATIQLQRSRCASIFGTPCDGVQFVPNATADCRTLGGGRNSVCTGYGVSLPIVGK